MAPKPIIAPPKPKKDKQNPKKQPILDDILKYLTCEAGVNHYINSTPKYDGYEYILHSTTHIRLSTSSAWQLGSAIWGSKISTPGRAPTVSVVPYYPMKMYDVSETLRWHTPDLSSHVQQMKLPHVPGATKFRFQGSTVIYFIPYKPAFTLPKEYYERIIVYKWSAEHGHTHCFDYTRKDFHITCASSSPKYLVLSRLPYSEKELTIEARAHHTEKSLHSKISTLQDQIGVLLQKNQYQKSKKLNQLQQQLSNQRQQLQRHKMEQENQSRRLREEAERLRPAADAQQQALLKRINRDSVDFFVWDDEKNPFPSYSRVMEYHKPADEVQVFKD